MRMRVSTTALFAAILVGPFSAVAAAQVPYGGIPPSSWAKFSSALQVVELPDVQEAIPDLNVPPLPGEPLRYGVVVPVRLSAEEVGVWEELPDGDLVWRVAIHSNGAHSLAATFSSFEVPPGGQLFVLSRTRTLGSFIDINANVDGSFAFEPLAGDEIVLEYFEPRDARFHAVIEIDALIHDYRNVFALLGAPATEGSGSCEVNVICEPSYASEKRAVVRLLAGGALCTGAMINNTSNNGRRLLMTAHHCGNMNSAVVYFNFDSSSCGSDTTPVTQTVSGTTLRAARKQNDFRLVEITPTIPASYNHYFLGWNRTNSIPTSTVCIHHPSGDVKKISFDNDVPTRLSLEWRINVWDSGVTEPGSSGSPLMTQSGRYFIGQLWGGASFCGNPVNDYYRRFDLAWPYVATFLDPLGAAPNTLSGYDPP